MGEEEDKNHVRVEDRRFFDKEGNPVHEDNGSDQKVRQEENQAPLPKIDFPSFLFVYVQTVLIHLGDLADPIDNKIVENLQAARQTIDILEMLKEKTKGNLSPQEDQYFESILFDLRLRFVEKSKSKR